MSNFAKKLARRKEKEAKTAAFKARREQMAKANGERMTLKEFYAPVVNRKRELRKQGYGVMYYVSTPKNVSDNKTVEEFGEAGTLVY